MPRFEPKRELDQWHAHESLDRMHVILEMFHLFVREHPFVDKTPHLSEKAEQVSDMLGYMYQAIGAEYSKYEDEDNI